ncbi:hypothetical protein ABZ801_14745 [Actinomadura sp. NPDC047616]|uniref:hypothetical protein n=1 Tax=Actinomadura sp. NPDC047616 TaxID=3155914 RepID=UPI003409E642
MATPPFPMYSPRTPADGGPLVRPRYGAGRADDPGYLRSLRTGTVLARLRAVMLVLAVAQVLILAISPLLVPGGPARLPAPWTVPPLAAAVLVAALAGPRTPRPLRPGRDREQAAAAALLQFRQAILVRFALADAVILLGLALAVTTRDEPVFLAAFALGYPLLLGLALPTAGGVERVRRRLEAGGADSHLWAVLLAPAPDRRHPPTAR